MLQKIGLGTKESRRHIEGNNSSPIKLTNHSSSANVKIPSKGKKVTTKQTMDQNLTQQTQKMKIGSPRGKAMPELD